MATLYGKGKGKAGSHAPKSEKPHWLKIKPAEVKKIIVELAKKDLTSAQIGLVLRDKYGIPGVKVVVGKKIHQIMTEAGIKPERYGLIALEKRAKSLRKHLEHNHKDTRAKRGLQLTEAKFRRLRKYYKMPIVRNKK